MHGRHPSPVAWAALAACAALVLGTLAAASPIGVNPSGDASGDYAALSLMGDASTGETCDYEAPLPLPPPCLGLVAVSATGEARGGLVSVGGGQVAAAVGECAAAPGPGCVPGAQVDALVDGTEAAATHQVDAAQSNAQALAEFAQRNGNAGVDFAQAAAGGGVDVAQALAANAVDAGQGTARDASGDPAGFAGRTAEGAQQLAGNAAAEAAEFANEVLAGAPGRAQTVVEDAQEAAANAQATVEDAVEDAPGTVDEGVARLQEGVASLPNECVQVEQDATCSDVAVSVTGDSRAHVLAVSGAGTASACQPELLCLAASGTGPAEGYFAVSLTGPADACEPGTDYVCTAVSVAGPARGDDYAISVLGDAEGNDAAVSVFGHASGAVAVSGCDTASQLCTP